MRDARRRGRCRGAALAAAVPLLLALSGCSLFGDDDTTDGDSTPVLDAQVGQCFAAPTKIEALVTDLEAVPCAQEHAREAYASITYEPTADETGDAFPGEEALTAFADGACAEAFTSYVGIDYLDSQYFFTYLLPSPRSWEGDDHEVLCLITTTGSPLTGSVKGSKA